MIAWIATGKLLVKWSSDCNRDGGSCRGIIGFAAVTSLARMLVSQTEMTVSLSPNRSKPTSVIARMTRKNGLFTSTTHLLSALLLLHFFLKYQAKLTEMTNKPKTTMPK
jgi:hypothetical protein